MSLQDGVVAQTTQIQIQELKQLFSEHLCEAGSLKQPEGIETGLAAFDRFTVWQGLPKGALSLFKGSIGTGATSLWISAAAQTVNSGRFVAWVNRDIPLCPLSLEHRGMDLSRFITIDRPESDDKLFWLLQELMSASLFELIGCDLGELRLKPHQLRKLQAQAREAHVGLVFLSQTMRERTSRIRHDPTLYALIVKFEGQRTIIERALHRPTPHTFPSFVSLSGSLPEAHSGASRSVSYARFTIHTGDRIGFGSLSTSSDNSISQQSSLPETSRPRTEAPPLLGRHR